MNTAEFLSEHKFSQIDTEFPDEEKFPLYYKARKTVVELNEGEMLFIPAGMFHMVISCNDGFNFAVNYWYQTKWSPGQPSQYEHKIQKHNIPEVDFKNVFKDSGKMQVYTSKSNLFPSNQVLHRYKDLITYDYMTFDEFMTAKNSHHYIVQGEHPYFFQYTPPFSSPLEMSKIWANFGGNTTTLMHYDAHENWLCQIKGKKKVILFPHEDRHLLYMWNPLGLNIINDINFRMSYFGNFISTLNNIISDELCTEIIKDLKQNKHGFSKNTELFIILKHSLSMYNNTVRVNMTISDFELVEPPWKFKLVNTNNIDYLDFTDNKHPYVFIAILQGKGAIMINGNRSPISKGMTIVLPYSFVFDVRLQGDMIFATTS
jgi:mannose-6-phosphate isomerase-like protein (cupin superfamily)